LSKNYDLAKLRSNNSTSFYSLYSKIFVKNCSRIRVSLLEALSSFFWKESISDIKTSRHIVEYLLMYLCSISSKTTRELIDTFVRKVFASSACNLTFCNLSFIEDIEKRCDFHGFNQWVFSVDSLYTCSLLIKHKINIHQGNIGMELLFGTTKKENRFAGTIWPYTTHLYRFYQVENMPIFIDKSELVQYSLCVSLYSTREGYNTEGCGGAYTLIFKPSKIYDASVSEHSVCGDSLISPNPLSSMSTLQGNFLQFTLMCTDSTSCFRKTTFQSCLIIFSKVTL
jgi:hypothetical protein